MLLVGSAAVRQVSAQQTAIVTPSGNDATGQFGDLAKPFQTIQAAIDAVPSTTDPPTSWTILIAPGQYDEDLAIDATNRHLSLLGLGPWHLGKFNEPGGTSAWSPTKARNINVSTTLMSTVNNVRSSLTIGALTAVDSGFSTHLAYSTAARIAGQIRYFAGTASAASTELHLAGVQIFGLGGSGRALDTSDYTGAVHLWAWRTRFGATTPVLTPQVFGPSNLRVQVAHQCRFDGPFEPYNYARVESCRIRQGMTVTSAGADEEPSGIIGCEVSGNFVGPTGAFRYDGNTAWWWVNNGATPIGPHASKVLQDTPGVDVTLKTAATDVDVLAGQVVYAKPTANVGLARADVIATADAAGLATVDALATFSLTYRTQGVVSLSDWTAVTGTVSLSPGQRYFLSAAAGGKLVTSMVAGPNLHVYIGKALSSTELDVDIDPPIKLV